MRFTAFAMLLGMVVLTAGGCMTQKLADPAQTFEVSGPIGIDVESFAGNVYIVADDDAREVSVRAVRKGTHGFERRDESKESLWEIVYDTGIAGGELGQVLRVRTGTGHAEPHFHQLDLHITAPEINGVRVRTRRGDVWAKSVTGPIDIETTYGEVRVYTNRPILQPVTIMNKYGDINYRVRGESTGAIDAEAVGGRVFHTIRRTKSRIDPGTDHDTLLARFNDGQNPIVLRTVDGDIQVAVVEEPENVGQLILHGYGITLK